MGFVRKDNDPEALDIRLRGFRFGLRSRIEAHLAIGKALYFDFREAGSGQATCLWKAATASLSFPYTLNTVSRPVR
jgi:hypothetical protein